jgi:hypothetical protein
MDPTLANVLASAARLQEVVPDAVLVGGSAAAHHAGHRVSFDHDHVVEDLDDRFETVLNSLEALADWSTARAQPGKIILGSLGGIESGVRQLRRARPLEVEMIEVEGRALRIPTIEETLRIKAWLAMTRNQTRDYLDIAALSATLGPASAAAILRHIDDFYDDVYEGDDRVVTQLVRQLADPVPRDPQVTEELDRYRRLDPAWHDWSTVVGACRALARLMLEEPR